MLSTRKRFRKPRVGKAVRSKDLKSDEPAGLMSWLSLAVIGCHPVRARTMVDIGELGRTSTDAPKRF